MKPVMQVFGLVLEKLLKMQGKLMMLRQLNKEIKSIETSTELEKESKNKKIETLRNKYVQTYLFDKYINLAETASSNVKTLQSFFG